MPRERRLPHTNRKARKLLWQMTVRSPKFRFVKVHTKKVKQTANLLSKLLITQRIKVDRGLVNQLSLAHDSFKDKPNHDAVATTMWQKLGAEKIAKSLNFEGGRWGKKGYKHWVLESNIFHWADNVSCGVRVGKIYINGVVDLDSAHMFQVSQLIESNTSKQRIDLIGREIGELKEFEKSLLRRGVDVSEVIGEMKKKNPLSFTEAFGKAINPKTASVIAESKKRLRAVSNKLQ